MKTLGEIDSIDRVGSFVHYPCYPGIHDNLSVIRAVSITSDQLIAICDPTKKLIVGTGFRDNMAMA